ncbi:hypothetical protein ACIHEJ_38670 [Streptomyces sp. NPDC052301]|uniref:hypothetical protein n=1 Tax=Streptomyces sp. NPDC052301 TaxID=3365687 RepID=UPI0037D3A9EE
MATESHLLSLRIVVPPQRSRHDTVECRPIVDGRDILAEVFAEGPGVDPRYLVGPDAPLHATDTPREVRLAAAACTEGCCGALYVTIRRERQHVIWSGWRNPDEDDVDFPELRFGVNQYEAEVRRASTDHSWEWPARTVARILEGSDPTDQAEHLEAHLTAEDPREVGEVCGGSKEFAERLGHPWPRP